VLRDALAGSQVQQHQAKAGLVMDDSGQKPSLVEFNELLQIVFLHGLGTI
jgi:hypothetical protein